MSSLRVSAVLTALILSAAVPVLGQPIPVLFMSDDAQDNNWENVTVAAFESHLAEGVPLGLGVIPCAHGSSTSATGEVTCLDDEDGTVFHDNYSAWITDNPGQFEVIQHAVTHSGDERLANFSRETQAEIVNVGLQRMRSWNLPRRQPAAFSVPFASANQDTVDVAEELGFRVFTKASRTFSLVSDSIEILVYPVLVCELDGGGNPVDGAECVFRTPADLIAAAREHASELEDAGKLGAVVVLYHVQDLLISNEDGQEAVDPQKVLDLREILAAFRERETAGEFDLMTPQQLFATYRCLGRRVTMLGTSANDELVGGPGADVINGLGGDDVIRGNDGDDRICGSAGNDQISGGAGDDLIHGQGGDDDLAGNVGNDTLFGGPGNDALNGGAGDDRLIGHSGADFLAGGGGADGLFGGGGDDTMNGGGGNDTLSGHPGNDSMAGGPGDDKMNGGGGNDTVRGNDGDDQVVGGPGNDHLDGGPGSDLCRGGGGADVLQACER